MAKKISQFTEATTIKSGDISVVVQDGETKQFPLDLLVTKAQADEYKADVETQLADYEQEITNIKNQYDKELYTPTITVTNTSMVKTGQGDTVDYSASVEDGVAKSAILKGDTKIINEYGVEQADKTIFHSCYFEQGTIGGMIGSTINKENSTLRIRTINPLSLEIGSYSIAVITGYEVYVKIIDSTNNIGIRDVGFDSSISFNITDSSKEKVYIVFRKSGSANITTDEVERIVSFSTIPELTLSLVSVKIPVLKTTGKNLFNPNLFEGKRYLKNGNNVTLVQDKSYSCYDIPIPAKKGDVFTWSTNDTSYKVIIEFDVNGGLTNYSSVLLKERIYTVQNELTAYIKMQTSVPLSSYLITEPQLEKSPTKTPYELYKSNILTVNEPIELRGIGDVKDELNLLTGELTSSLGEVVLDGTQKGIGSQVWGNYTKTRFELIGAKDTRSGGDDVPLMSDKLKPYGYWGEADKGEYFFTGNNYIDIVHSNEKDIVQWLKDNPTLIIYPLIESTIKTVDLNTSGTLASETPYMWKNGSIQLSSDGLVPVLDYEVTTSRVGVIETNMSETIVNEKRIHVLEVMLAQSTITAAADAVSLQSDLETTTMSVDGAQLETGNTQDDFLYEMILLLIEKDAYDESLFDKVCAFYLYGKLSDEQFTNIYSLLYPEEE